MRSYIEFLHINMTTIKTKDDYNQNLNFSTRKKCAVMKLLI